MKKLLKFIKKIFIKVESVFYVGETDILKEPLTGEQRAADTGYRAWSRSAVQTQTAGARSKNPHADRIPRSHEPVPLCGGGYYPTS